MNSFILLGSFLRILGDQTTMIQVALIVGAVAVFWLSRSVK